jgi:hypothetical protein
MDAIMPNFHTIPSRAMEKPFLHLRCGSTGRSGAAEERVGERATEELEENLKETPQTAVLHRKQLFIGVVQSQ